MESTIINAEKAAMEAADNYTENRDILVALEDNGFTLSDLADNLGIGLEELEATLHRDLSYNDEKAGIMRTIDRMVDYRNDHQPEE